MADTTHTIGSTGIVKRLVDNGDGTYSHAVILVEPSPSTEVVVAGAASTLGKIATLANTETIYIRQASAAYRDIEWRVKADQTHTIQKYKARTIVNGATITMADATRVDDADTFTLNGLTYTAAAIATDAAYASRKWKSAGADTDADVAALAALINADYAVVTAGTSVAATDKLVITTDEGAHTIEAKATTADYPNGKYLLNVTQATELASIILAINHKANVTLANVSAGDTVTINGLTFTGHATTTTAANREFAVNGTDTQDGDGLVTCLQDATYGLGTGYTAANASGVVSITRNSAAAAVVTITSSNGTRLAVQTAGGVPGVIAAATGVAGELSITPTWTGVLTVTEAGDRLTVTDIDCPGILATAALHVITLTCSTPGAPTGGDKASTIQFGQGTSDAAEIAFADTTLVGLAKDGAEVTDTAANSTTAGTLYDQDMNGWEYGYLGVTNKSGGAAMTLVVGATTH